MASRGMAVGTAAGRPVLSAGGPCRCRSTSVHGASRVAGQEIAPAMYMPPVPYAAGALSVAPRPAERRCRSALLGRGWERPPISACLNRHRGRWGRTAPSPRRYGVSPSQQSPCGEGVGRSSFAPASDVSKPPRRLAGRSGARGALDPSRCAQPRAASMISAT